MNSMDITVMHSGAGAATADATWAILEAANKIKQNWYDSMRQNIEVAQATSEAQADSTKSFYDQEAQKDRQMAIQSFSQAGTTVGMQAGTRLYNTYKYNSQLKTAQTNKANAETYETALKDRLNTNSADVELTTLNSSNARSAQQETTLQRLKNKDMTSEKITTAERDAIEVSTKEEAQKMLKNASKQKDGAQKQIESIDNEKQMNIRTMNMVTEAVNNGFTGFMKIQTAAANEIQGKIKYIETLMQYTTQALETANQLANAGISQQDQAIQAAFDTMNAVREANRAA